MNKKIIFMCLLNCISAQSLLAINPLSPEAAEEQRIQEVAVQVARKVAQLNKLNDDAQALHQEQVELVAQFNQDLAANAQRRGWINRIVACVMQ